MSGAAAKGHGLALLGGGTLAAGGAGMAGGMAAVAGAGATAGLVGAGGGSLLVMLCANAARAEIIKLQVNYKAAVLQDQAHTKKAQDVIKRLADTSTSMGSQERIVRVTPHPESERLKLTDWIAVNAPTIEGQFARRTCPAKRPADMPLATAALEPLARPISAACIRVVTR